jgi:uncharacterized protein
MKNIVFDTNVYISGILFNGSPRQCIELAVEGKFVLFISPDIIEEISLVLSRDKFQLSPERIHFIENEIESITQLVTPQKKIQNICRDIKDHIILECALASNSEIIVTGDNDLLSINGFQNISILNCRSFVELF